MGLRKGGREGREANLVGVRDGLEKVSKVLHLRLGARGREVAGVHQDVAWREEGWEGGRGGT